MRVIRVDNDAYLLVDFPNFVLNRLKLRIDLLKIFQILFILSLMKPTEQPTRDNLKALILTAALPTEGPIIDFILVIQMFNIGIYNATIQPRGSL